MQRLFATHRTIVCASRCLTERPASRIQPQLCLTRRCPTRRAKKQVTVHAVVDDGPLVAAIRNVRRVCWLSFWSQLALSLTSAGILLFTLVATKARPLSSLFLLAGVASSLISTGVIRKILSDARATLNAPDVRIAFGKWNPSGWLLRNTDINLIGMAASIVALQGECGMLVAKLLRTSTTTVSPYAVPPPGGAPASIDVFAVQGCANVLLAHFVSLLFLTLALRRLERYMSTYAIAA